MTDQFLKGLEDIPRNRDERCGRCGIPLTIDNDSGWEAFFEDKNGKQYSQRICGWCDAEDRMTVRPIYKLPLDK